MSHFYKYLLPFAAIFALVYIALSLIVLKWQSRLIFVPSQKIEITPKELDVPYDEVWLPVNETDRLHGWWIPSPVPRIGVVLYFHGNANNISSHINEARMFRQLGFDVLLVDYRGYGRSVGQFPNEERVYQDAQIAWDYLTQQKSVEPQDIFIYGHSLGGAIAIELAVNNPQVAALIIEGSFTSIRQMGEYRTFFSIFPLDLIVHQHFDSLSKIKHLQMPLLFIHGIEDTVVPAKMSQVLYDAATAPKKLLLVPNADHNDVALVGGEKYWQTVWEFYQMVRSDRGKVISSSDG